MKRPQIRTVPPRAFEWRKGFNSNFILSELAKCRTVANGKCSFKAAEHQFWLPILKSAIVTQREVGTRKARCIERALSTPTLTLKDANAFIDTCNDHYQASLQTPAKTFLVLCSFTYEGEQLFKALSDGKCDIRWVHNCTQRAYRRAWEARKDLEHLLTPRGVPFREKGLTDLMVAVPADSAQDAVIEARDAVDRMRGILNLIVNSNRSLDPFVGLGMSKPHAVNRFRPGPYVSVHDNTGSLAAEMFWYEPRWAHETSSVKFKGPKEKARRSIAKWWRRSLTGPLKDHVTDGLLRYCRALDRHESDAALIGLWGAIEALTCTQEAKYDVTVKRISKMFYDQTAARQVAQHVRERRNSYIHAANSPTAEESEAILYHADMLANRILSFCIKNECSLQNIEELAHFLDLTSDEVRLKRERALAARMIRYMRTE